MKRIIIASENDMFKNIEEAAKKVIFGFYDWFNTEYNWTDDEDGDGNSGYKPFDDLHDFNFEVEERPNIWEEGPTNLKLYRVHVEFDRRTPSNDEIGVLNDIGHELDKAVSIVLPPNYIRSGHFLYQYRLIDGKDGKRYKQYQGIIREIDSNSKFIGE